MIHVFDMDGTLVDSRDAVRASYADVGITMPDDAWGKPWRHWLPQLCSRSTELAQEVHQNKNEAYMRRIGQVRPLPLARSLALLHGRIGMRTAVVTGASHAAAHHILTKIIGVAIEPEEHGVLLSTEQDLSGKAHAIAAFASVHDEGIYYDDDLRTCEVIDQFLTTVGATRHQWSICHVR